MGAFSLDGPMAGVSSLAWGCIPNERPTTTTTTTNTNRDQRTRTKNSNVTFFMCALCVCFFYVTFSQHRKSTLYFVANLSWHQFFFFCIFFSNFSVSQFVSNIYIYRQPMCVFLISCLVTGPFRTDRWIHCMLHALIWFDVRPLRCFEKRLCVQLGPASKKRWKCTFAR